jgi:arylsulfatase A-like enzyme
VIVTSDHGFSTVRGRLGVTEALIEAGLKASKDSLDVIVTGGFVCVPDGNHERTEAVARCLMSIDGVGAVFSGARGEALEGTLPMSLLGAASGLAPDIIFSPDWDDEPNAFGVPGTVRGSTDGSAHHGSLSRWEVRNTLVAAGPGFQQGLVSDLPAATIDIAPTLAALLGLGPFAADGRVLVEALAEEDDPPSLKRIVRTAEHAGFRQEVRMAVVGTTPYVDSARRLP